MKKLPYHEYIEVLHHLDMKHAAFYRFWEMGRPMLVDDDYTVGGVHITTGAVVFDTSTGKCIRLVINESYWNGMNVEQKAFLIAHECLHLIYKHYSRLFKYSKNELDFLLMNIAADIVNNHRLLELGFNRDEIEQGQGGCSYCWVDNVFSKLTDDIPPPDKSSSYYYHLLKELLAKNPENGESVLGSVKLVDDHVDPSTGDNSEGGSEALDKVVEDLLNSLDSQSKKDLLSDFQKRHEELDKEMNERSSEGGGGKGQDYSTGDTIKKMMAVRPKPGRLWRNILKEMNASFKSKDEFALEERWGFDHRRMTCLPKDIDIPAEIESVRPNRVRRDCFMFLDTSGSCAEYAERFWKIASSIDQKWFNVRLFCFSDTVYPINLEDQELRGFGGTSFVPLEKEIQKVIKSQELKYPDVVFVITDGMGDRVFPEKPERWWWLLTENSATDCIPKGSKVLKLEDYE